MYSLFSFTKSRKEESEDKYLIKKKIRTKEINAAPENNCQRKKFNPEFFLNELKCVFSKMTYIDVKNYNKETSEAIEPELKKKCHRRNKKIYKIPINDVMCLPPIYEESNMINNLSPQIFEADVDVYAVPSAPPLYLFGEESEDNYINENIENEEMERRRCGINFPNIGY